MGPPGAVFLCDALLPCECSCRLPQVNSEIQARLQVRLKATLHDLQEMSNSEATGQSTRHEVYEIFQRQPVLSDMVSEACSS